MSEQGSAPLVPWRALLALAPALVSACAAHPAPSQPVGQPTLRTGIFPCDTGESLPLGRPVFSSTTFGQDRVRASCVRAEAPECVFRLRLDERSDLHLSLESGSFDGSLALFSATRGEPRELACSDDAPTGDTHHARIDATLAQGEYLVVVDGVTGEAGDFELFAEAEPLPAIAATCANAEPLVPGRVVRGSTRGGPNLFSATCAGGAQGPDHVYVLRLDEPSRVRILQEGDYDGALVLRARCEDPSTELVCNDDFRDGLHSGFTAELEAGSYYVITDSYSRGQSGDFVLSVERTPVPPTRSLHDVCRDVEAKPVPAGTYELDTLYARSLTHGSCGGRAAPEHMLAFDVTTPSLLVAELEDAELNAALYVRRACEDPKTEEGCFVAPRIDRTRAAREQETTTTLVAPLSPGRHVLVIDGAEMGEMGAARVRFSLEPLPGASR